MAVPTGNEVSNAKNVENLRFHIRDSDEEGSSPAPGPRGPIFRSGKGFNSDEAAARNHLNALLTRDTRPVMRGLAAPDRPELVPDLKFQSTEEVPRTGTKLVRFTQTQQDRPVFGAAAVVELSRDQSLVSANLSVAKVERVSPFANLSEKQALEKIALATGKRPDVLERTYHPQEAPRLCFFRENDDDSVSEDDAVSADRRDVWHLAYLFKEVPAAPKEDDATVQLGHGLGSSPRSDQPLVNYLVDAHDGAILFYYGATPTQAAHGTTLPRATPLPVPARCKGIDEEGVEQVFRANELSDPQRWEMHDTTRSIKTYDLKFGNIVSAQLPTDLVQYERSYFDQQSAAISAHINATRVHDFFDGVLQRQGIDNQGMDLVSVVNCTYNQPPPQWHNAVWWKKKMWYGQRYEDGDQKLHSFSRYLDVIAHELTHGVTETTASLVYWGQSGALNESFSDIFGIIIKNWYRFDSIKMRDNMSNWSWEIGEGLGENGLPLRDLSDPQRTGQPGHMDQYVTTTADFGGVHTNSNIHNKAAYYVLSARNDTGQVFLPEEIALLYYMALLRLNSMATFSQALQALLDVAGTYYADADERKSKTDALKRAYSDAGIQ